MGQLHHLNFMEMYVLLIANLVFLATWILFIFLNTRKEIGTRTEVHMYIGSGIVCISEVVYLIVTELYRLLEIKNVFDIWKKQQKQAFIYELQHCNPAWPEDQVYLKKKLKELSGMKPYYQITMCNQGNLDADLTMERLKILVQRENSRCFFHDRLLSHFYICKMCAPLEVYHNTDATISIQEHLRQSCTTIAQQLHELGVFLKTKMIDNQGYGGLQQRKQENKSINIIQQDVKLLQNKMVTMVKNQEKKSQLLSLELQLLSCLVETMGIALEQDSFKHLVDTQ